MRTVPYKNLRYDDDIHKIWDFHSNFCFLALELIYVLRKGKPKALPAAPFDLFISSVSCDRNQLAVISEMCLVHEKKKMVQ